MSKVLVVFGATGQQGGSVVDYVLNDPILSKQFSIRAVTRDTSSGSAQALTNKGVEVVKADVADGDSLRSAMTNGHTVFAVTITEYHGDVYGRELAYGKAIADAAVAEGVEYLIWSTLPNVNVVSGGKYANVGSFDAKADVEAYIRTLAIKSAFFAPGSFMQNLLHGFAPRPTGNGDYVMAAPVSPETEWPMIDTAGDTGKWVGAILAEPEKYEGKVFSAATEVISLGDIAKLIGQVNGKVVKYNQVPVDTWKGFLPPIMGEQLAGMLLYQQDFGYYGKDTHEKVNWAVENARGKLTTLEDFLKANPLKLE